MPDAPTPLPCRFDGDHVPDAPRVWALALNAPGLPPEAARQHARTLARTALRALLAEHFQLPAHAITLSSQRGALVCAELTPGTPVPPSWPTLGLSISHEHGLTLLALHAGGDEAAGAADHGGDGAFRFERDAFVFAHAQRAGGGWVAGGGGMRSGV